MFFFLRSVSSVKKFANKRGEKEEHQKLKVHEIEEIRGGAMEDLNDYTIIKEGEAEILMHARNEVFYNKTQVKKYFLLAVFHSNYY